MELKMLKLINGPLVVVEVKKELADDWMETRYYRPLNVFQADDGSYKIGMFLELSDFDKPFSFRDISFECMPNADVVAAYHAHWNPPVEDAPVSEEE